jgi:predicted aspartyl protease
MGKISRDFGSRVLIAGLMAMLVAGLHTSPGWAAQTKRDKVTTSSNWAGQTRAAEQPITRHSNGSITTPVYINRKGPFPFLVDTGAALSGVNRVTIIANDLSYKEVDEVIVLGAAGRSTMRLLRFQSLISSIYEMKNPRLLELPNSFLGARQIERGVLGTDFWANHTVVFDTDRDKIVLYPKSYDLTEGLPNHFDEFEFRYTRRDNGLFARVKINGNTHTALIDTGASLTFVNEKLAKRLNIDTTIGYEENAIGISGRRITHYRTKVASIEAGTRTWTNVSIGLTEFPGGPKYDLVLGMSLLAQTPFAIDYHRKRVLLVKP